ncbi:hypothetical protein AGLY_004196 [Aphis glycines]|uniref:Uncharacterized protein n=1 Tax=Aphis glycines TaxID=307491 RepID=A0A6G0TYA7_APHGL|nr:hypothetical protein AGLY_004196 [Aphis glycines]
MKIANWIGLIGISIIKSIFKKHILHLCISWHQFYNMSLAAMEVAFYLYRLRVIQILHMMPNVKILNSLNHVTLKFYLHGAKAMVVENYLQVTMNFSHCYLQSAFANWDFPDPSDLIRFSRCGTSGAHASGRSNVLLYISSYSSLERKWKLLSIGTHGIGGNGVGLASSVSAVPYARLNDDEEAVLQAVPVDHELTIHFLLFQSKKKITRRT